MIIAYVTLVLLFYVLFTSFSFGRPVAILLGLIIRGTPAYMINSLCIALLVTLLYGLLRQKRFTYHVGLVWFTFSFVNVAAMLFLNRGLFATLSQSFNIIMGVTILLIDIIILWYFFEKRPYFTASPKALAELHPPKSKKKKKQKRSQRLMQLGVNPRLGKYDKVFVTVLATIWIIFIIFFLVLGTRMYKEMLLTTISTMDELEDKFLWQSRDLCLERTGLDRDVCYVVLADQIDNRDLIEALGVCELIESDLLKVACYKI
jgi:hypothetical protein